ncbi:PREDICTED: uncharacterized protein LOC104715251 [Camelina sativa]|uniref:Uncharacterized protein LOC104715251 n=1 Tax=Camelina sativa TaxID=90675 RepID=A0ABM0TT66_CAMSA|nr:PREDICTED: uncharacterized protein LOC104715251 [Camelina sativa]
MDKLRRALTIDGLTFSVEIASDDDPLIEPHEDITAGYVKELDTAEKVSKQAAKLEDWSGDHLISTRYHDVVLIHEKSLVDDVFVMETRIAEKGLSFLASPVGEPKRLHPDTELVTNFGEAKIFIEVNLMQELPKTYFFTVRGEEVCVQYEYPWLPHRCSFCKRWGHSDDGCLVKLVKSNVLFSSQSTGMPALPSAQVVSPAATVPTPASATTTLSNLPVAETAAVNPPVVYEGTGGTSNEGDWTAVTHSGGKNSKNLQKQLVFGQVRIASPTQTGKETVLATVRKPLNSKDQVALCVQQPRNSKNAHKFLSDSSQQATETKVQETNVSRVLGRTFGDWNLVSNYEFSRLGRVWVLGSRQTTLQVVFKSGQLITCSVKLGGGTEEFWCSFIYACNTVEERKERWRDIQQQHDLASLRGKPWILMGDFNETLDIDEHSNSLVTPMVTLGMRDFHDTQIYCSLVDLRAIGPLFTWCNNQENGPICKKLDRILHSVAWDSFFPNSYFLMEAGGCSDHLRGKIYLDAGKLKQLKPLLRELSCNKLSDISRRATAAYEDLCAKKLAVHAHPTLHNLAEEASANARWEHVAGLEETFLKQRSKLHWLHVGDKNNRAFYNAIKERQSLNFINEVIDPSGRCLTTMDDIKAEGVRFFSHLLTHQPPAFTGLSTETLQDLLPVWCSLSQQDALLLEVSGVEVKQVLFRCHQINLQVEFFKSAWSVLGPDLTKAVQSFFQFGFLPKGVNTTILALIPKTTTSKEMKDYRPISCCNVLYKIISKLLANRLKAILPNFIAPNQSAFIKDRLLMENILLATEIVKDYHKEGISPKCAMKIDISKAFDSVQWPFLLNVLTALNLPTKAAAARHFGYHPRCKGLQLTHLCFADDIMVFSDGRASSMEGILHMFKDFAAYSSLCINLEKSTLFLAGVSSRSREALLTQFPFAAGTLPVRYLGLRLLTKRMTIHDCLPLIERIRSHIGSWKHRFLSFAGRLQLLSSVIASLTKFWISAFRLPSACVQEIERICAAFL